MPAALRLQDIRQAWVHGFSLRKFLILKQFLPHAHLRRIKNLDRLPHEAVLILWGMQPVPAHIEASHQIIRVEDGFLRSVGLGAAFNAPISWVFDDAGMYFNTLTVSRLERILNYYPFTADQKQKAELIRQEIIQQKLSKYNLSAQDLPEFPLVKTGKKILAVGQVEGDASLQFGSPELKSNIAFLEQVRQLRPNDYIVYRPHPDVSSGWRKDSLDMHRAERSADSIHTQGDIADWLDWADEVHVMTSLTGFEALMRHKKVVCHGLPFYSGWGLTQDLIKVDRPKRVLSLSELTAGTLMLYPSYHSLLLPHRPKIEIDQAMQELQQLRMKKKVNWLNWLQKFMKY